MSVCEHGNLKRSCEICERDAEIARLRADKRELVEVCEAAILEIEYLHDKFTTTGSGNGILSKLISAVEKHKEGK